MIYSYFLGLQTFWCTG